MNQWITGSGDCFYVSPHTFVDPHTHIYFSLMSELPGIKLCCHFDSIGEALVTDDIWEDNQYFAFRQCPEK